MIQVGQKLLLLLRELVPVDLQAVFVQPERLGKLLALRGEVGLLKLQALHKLPVLLAEVGHELLVVQVQPAALQAGAHVKLPALLSKLVALQSERILELAGALVELSSFQSERAVVLPALFKQRIAELLPVPHLAGVKLPALLGKVGIGQGHLRGVALVLDLLLLVELRVSRCNRRRRLNDGLFTGLPCKAAVLQPAA